MTVAVLTALLVVATMTAAVVWILRSTPNASPQQILAPAIATTSADIQRSANSRSTPTPQPSPTPRFIASVQRIPTFTPAPTTDTPLPPTATPNPTRIPSPTPEHTPTIAAAYLASQADVATWTGPNWSAEHGYLAHDGAAVTSEPWLVIPYDVPDGPYAVEADIRVLGVGSEYCEQSFGIVAGGSADLIWGGGIVFACDAVRRARLTDVSNWSDGYNRDRTLAAAAVDLDAGWHAYRLEVDGTHLRFLIDGTVVIAARDDAAQYSDTPPGHLGLWSQGVALQVRRVAVFTR